jgi:hypothetical protein
MMGLDYASLWEKSKVLMDRALDSRDHQKDDDYQLWAALVLELLGKASLAKMHPALVADPQHADSLIAACGGPPSAEFKTIAAKTVFSRCHRTVAGFDQSCEDFCRRLADDRNAHLHSGAVPFAARRPDAWQSKYWAVIELLVLAQGRTLDELLGPDEASAARVIIADAKRTREVHVLRRVASHREEFAALSQSEQGLRSAAARLLEAQLKLDAQTTRNPLNCPSCENPGEVDGEVVYEVEGESTDSDAWARWFDCTIKPESFQCAACGLKLDGEIEMASTGLSSEYEKAMLYEDDGDPYGND